MSRTSSPTARQRRTHCKTRTGCRECRARRVKCDENRPVCKRCATNGRVCDGNGAQIRIVEADTASDGTISLRWTRPSSPLSHLSDAESSAFDFFRIEVLDRLSGPFDNDVWQSLVLPLSTTEPCILGIVSALGSPRGTPEQERAATVHYTKAMKALRSRLSRPEYVSEEVVLVACLLFIAFEWQRGIGWDQAMSHFNCGLKVLDEARCSPNARRRAAKQDLGDIEEAFKRLDVQVAMVTSQRTQLAVMRDATMFTELPAPANFQTLTEARRCLTAQMAAARNLLYAIEMQRFAVNGLSASDYALFSSQATRLLLSLDRWRYAMDVLEPKLSGTRVLAGAKTLRAQHIACNLTIKNCLSDGRETTWDQYLAEFERLVENAEDAVALIKGDAPGKRSRHSEPARPRFALDMGVIPPLYCAALRCRNPRLRRRAVAVMCSQKQQEGFWNCPRSATMAMNIVNLEESRVGPNAVERSEDVPENSRLYQAWYDLRIGMNVVHCKRRSFETDGDWVEWVQCV